MMALPPGYDLRDGADPVAAHAFLTDSYWANGITLAVVEQSLAHSLQVSIWHQDQQVAMAKVISDYTTFAYVNDVYVLAGHRGRGLAKAMIAALKAHPQLQTIQRWALFTKDAQALYEQFGWRQYPHPDRLMVIDDALFAA
jgi:predicted GNAT family acetyltransferase